MSGESSEESSTTDDIVVIAPDDTIIAIPRKPAQEPERPSAIRIGKIRNVLPHGNQRSPQRNP